MTTPTKEQIEILKEKWNNLTNASIETNLYWIITEWEKIRNKKQNACTKKSCWFYCESNSDGCFLPEICQHRPTCFISHKKAKESLENWKAKKREDK